MDILYISHSINLMPYILYVLHVPLARSYDIPNQFVQLLKGYNIYTGRVQP